MTATTTASPETPSPTVSGSRLRLLQLRAVGSVRAPRWWQELAFVAVVYELYTLVRNVVPSHEAAALRRAADLYAFEHSLHIGVERPVNAFVARTHWLAYGCDYYYATLHFAVTIAVLVWAYRRHPLRYRPLRTVLLVTNAIALLGFWLFALAPPRMLHAHGFVDTVVVFHTWGSWGSSGVDSASNQFAAMPSLHIGWSLWCALVLFRLSQRRLVRALAVLYPLATLFVIVGTANHFLLDAVGGVAVLSAGFAVQRLVSGRGAFALPMPAQPKNSRS